MGQQRRHLRGLVLSALNSPTLPDGDMCESPRVSRSSDKGNTEGSHRNMSSLWRLMEGLRGGGRMLISGEKCSRAQPQGEKVGSTARDRGQGKLEGSAGWRAVTM